MQQIKLENVASASARFIAFIVDSLICIVISFVFGMMLEQLFGANLSAEYVLFNKGIKTIVQSAAVISYYILLTYFTNGGTLGKMCVGIHVVCINENKLSFLTVLYRETVGRFLNAFLLIGYILVLFDSRRRSAADFLSDTLVVKNSPPVSAFTQSDAFSDMLS